MSISKREEESRRRIFEELCTNQAEWHQGVATMKACKLMSGRFFTIMDKMEEEGIIESKWLDDTMPRPRTRMYRLVN